MDDIANIIVMLMILGLIVLGVDADRSSSIRKNTEMLEVLIEHGAEREALEFYETFGDAGTLFIKRKESRENIEKRDSIIQPLLAKKDSLWLSL